MVNKFTPLTGEYVSVTTIRLTSRVRNSWLAVIIPLVFSKILPLLSERMISLLFYQPFSC